MSDFAIASGLGKVCSVVIILHRNIIQNYISERYEGTQYMITLVYVVKVRVQDYISVRCEGTQYMITLVYVVKVHSI